MRTEVDVLSKQVLGAAIDVHRELGPGLLESAYEACLCYELASRHIIYQRQHPLPVLYKGMSIDCEYRIDILLKTVLLLNSSQSSDLIPFMKLNC